MYSVKEKPPKTTRKIAIIGYAGGSIAPVVWGRDYMPGVGGSSAAYFLHELLGSSVEVYVFGDGKVGGRTGVVEYRRV